jgi:hypothetical protein
MAKRWMRWAVERSALKRMIVGERFPGRADRVQGIALGPGAPRRSPGPANLHHPLAVRLQEDCQPGAIAADTLHRPAAPTRHLRPGEVEQATITGRVRADRRLGKQAAYRVGGGGQGVAVGSTPITPSMAPANLLIAMTPLCRGPGSYRPRGHR